MATIAQWGHRAQNFDGLIGCVTVVGAEVYAMTDGGAWSFWEPR